MGKLAVIGKLLRTVKHLRPTQAYHQLLYKFKKAGKLSSFQVDVDQPQSLNFSALPEVKEVLKIKGDNTHFTFLNLSNEFAGKIDWNYLEHGKLWNYNLQYVDFVRQDNLSLEQREKVLLDLYQNLWDGIVPLEPYPVSLRIMNAIRFVDGQEGMEKVKKMIAAELNYLSQFLEFHILGNHLLENAFALLMGGHYFKHDAWIKRAEEILTKELKEQTTKDGAHFELSPMYHQIILFRVLESIDYLPEGEQFTNFIRGIADRMNSWLLNISFKNGSIPHFNDSSDGIAYTTPQLLNFGKSLGFSEAKAAQLSDSGYRKYEVANMELIADVHGISPSYQPGHAHADSFSFCLNHKDKAILVDTGISTYNICKQRDQERSTPAHNTISIDGGDSSEVWSGFRVGRRAKVKVLSEDSTGIKASHNGFAAKGVKHERSFSIVDDTILIEDKAIGKKPSNKAVAYFHFAAGTEIKDSDNGLVINDSLLISFHGKYALKTDNYFLCNGYNRLVDAPVVALELTGETLKTEISAI